MSAPNPLSERLRFAEFVLDRLPNGRCRAKVGLTWRDSEAFVGESEGHARFRPPADPTGHYL